MWRVTFSSLNSCLMLYCTLVRSKWEYASAAWNSVTSTYASALEHISRKFVSLCRCRFSDSEWNYVNVQSYFKFHSLSDWRCHLQVLSSRNLYSDSNFCPTLLQTVGLLVPNRNLRYFTLFNVTLKFATVLPLYARRQLMSSARTVICLVEGLFEWTVCWMLICLLSKHNHNS